MNEQLHLIELPELPKKHKAPKQACKRCISCIRVHYKYFDNKSAAYYCDKKESTRTKNGKQKLHYISLKNSCSMFSDKKTKQEPDQGAMNFYSKGFFKQGIN